MLEKNTLNGTDVVLTAQANAIENFVVCDLPGFADFADQLPTENKNVGKEGTRWWGGTTYQKSVTALRNGDMAGVPASDKLLAEMENACACVAVLAHSQQRGRHVSERAALPRRQSVQHATEAAPRHSDRAAVGLCRAGRQRRDRCQHVPQARGSHAGTGPDAGEP
jgi:hypothetical protein